MIHLRLSATGVLQRAGDEPVPLAPRDALLLAWLAIQGPTRRARLAALLWPDASEDGARTALRQRVFQLRRRFGTDLLADGPLVALGPDVTHDLDSAHSLLDGVDLDLGTELLEWLSAQRRSRHDTACRLLSDAADHAERSHDWPAAIGQAQQLLALAPLAEDAHRRLIRLHYLAGDRAAALLAFDRCEAVLKHEVGATPSAETLTLLRLVTDYEREAQVPMVTPRTALLRPPRLVGRDAARAALARAIDEGRIAIAIAEAGMGKSRLLEDAVDRCRAQGRAVLWIRARPGDSLQPNAVAARWLEELLALPGTEPPPDARPELARLLPALGVPSSVPDPRGDGMRRALSTALQGNVSRGLQVIVIDDLHHADEASLGLLLPIAEEGRCSWLLAMRGGELKPATRDWVNLQLQAGAMRVEVPTLTVAEVAELLESLSLSAYAGAAVAESLRRHTGGNPMYVLETLRARLSEAAPFSADRHPWPRAPGVRQLIGGRLARLSPLALNLVRCAAVAGPDLSADLAAAVLGLRSLDLTDAWAELESADVLRGTDFAHDLIGEAARDALPEPIARSLHADVARWMEQHGGAPARIASHWLAAGERSRPVPHLQEAARQAQAAWQLEDAAALWEQAADLSLEAGDRSGAFEALIRAAHARTEVVVDTRVERLAQTLAGLADDEGQQAAAALVRLVLLVESHRLDEAQSLAEQTLVKARRARRVDLEVELLWDLTVIHWELGRLQEASQIASTALARLDQGERQSSWLDMDTRPKLVHALGTILSVLGRFAEGNDYIKEAVALARRSKSAGAAAFELSSLADNALAQGDLAGALQYSAEALIEARPSTTGPAKLARTLKTRGVALALSGELGAALEAFDEASELAGVGVQRYSALIQRAKSWLHYELGRRDLALRGLRSLLEQPGIQPGERLLVEASLLHVGEAIDSVVLLDRLSALDSMTLRAQALSLAAPACEPQRVLPLLSLATAAAREHAAHGLWIDLQTQRAGALRTLGRHDEAREAALSVWRRLEAGERGSDLFPRTAHTLYLTWLGHDDEQAGVVALRAWTWMRQAAAGLPDAWRDSYLTRSPVLVGTANKKFRSLPRFAG